LLPTAEGHLVKPSKLERVRNVVTGSCAVAVEDAGGIPGERCPVPIRGHVDCMRVGVGALQEQAACHAAINCSLEGMIAAVCSAIPLPGCCGASEFRKKGPAGVARARYLRSVDVQKREPVHVRCPDVSDRRYKLARQLSLNDEVPRLDVTACHCLVRDRVP